MTIASTTNKHLYAGDGAQTVFPFTFRIWSAEDLRVVLRDTNGGETVLDLGTDYTVAGVGNDSGGSVTMTASPGAGERLLVKRDLELLQEIDLVENAATPADVLEAGYDKLTAMVQQLAEVQDRAVTLPETATEEETINIDDLTQAVADAKEAEATVLGARDETLSARDEAVAAAASLAIPPLSSDSAAKYLRQNAAGTAWEMGEPESMSGATASNAGDSGLVPAPDVGDQDRVLCGDGRWKDILAHSLSDQILSPAILSPAAGSVVDMATPTISGGPYRSLYGAPQAGLTVEIATDAAFANIVYTGSETGESTTHTVADGHIETSSTYYARLRYTDEDGNQSAWGDPVEFTTAASFAQIMGVALVTAGGGGGTWARVNANGDTIVPASGYFDAHPVWGGVTDVTIDGQAMAKIPAFYVKRGLIASGANAGKEAWWISDTPVEGFHLHPAFRAAGSDIDQIYIGKYQGSLNSAKLASLPGVAPAVSRSLTQFQADAAARNVSGVAGFMLWSIYQWSAIQWLYLIEKATMDSQTATGQGRVNTTSAANVDAVDVAQATYRGMVGLWGNVHQWMEGLKTGSNVISLWDANGNKTWVNTTRKRTAAAGWIYPTSFLSQSGTDYNFGDHFIGDTGPTTNSGATVPDGQYFSEANDYFPFVGGDWASAAGAGLWCVHCGYAASSSHPDVGARLAKV